MSKGNPGEERELGIGGFLFEEYDGPRYVQAVRGARRFKIKALVDFYIAVVGPNRFREPERCHGCPASFGKKLRANE